MEEDIKINKIDLMSPIRIFLSKDNWKSSLFIWLILFLIVGIIKPLLKISNQKVLDLMLDCVLSFLIFGYFRLYLHNVINDKGYLLPILNLRKMIITALSLSIIILPFILLEVVLFYFHIHTHNLLVKSPLVLIPITTILAIIFIVVNIYVFFIECAYLKDLEIKEGFRYFKIWKLFKMSWIDIIKTYFQAALILIPISCIFAIVVFYVNFLSIVKVINLPFILANAYSLIFYTVKMNLIGQVYKNTLFQGKNIKMNKERIIILITLFILILILMSIFSLTDLLKTFNLPHYLFVFWGQLLKYTFDYLLGF